MHRTPQALQTPLTTGIKTVTSVAVCVPTQTPAGESLPGGHTYLMLPATVNLRHLVHEKIAAEYRRARVAGRHQSTLNQLVGDDIAIWTPERDVFAAADRAFAAGVFSVLVDSQLVTDLDALIAITRATSIAVIVAAPVLV